MSTSPPISSVFARYTDHSPRVPVYCVTPSIERPLHRFFDTSPISPSGRYLAVTQLSVEDREPLPGENAAIWIVDLESGKQSIVHETHAWDTQLGAQVQWGRTDEDLFFNDLVPGEWTVFGVRFNPQDGTSQRLNGPVYTVSPDGKLAISPNLLRNRIVQAGYGAVVPADANPQYDISADGIFVTDLESGESRLLVSIEEIVSATNIDLHRKKGEFFGFHAKWNHDASRIMFVLRWMPNPAIELLKSGVTKKQSLFTRIMKRLGFDILSRTQNYIVTCDSDGGDIRIALEAKDWARGGHHPNWFPTENSILMNLVMPNSSGMSFVKIQQDGSQPQVLTGVAGSGHPTMHPDGIHILTDAYPFERAAAGDGTAPLRWVDVSLNSEIELLRIDATPRHYGKDRILRVDLHPAWNRDFTRVVFNGCPGTRRAVFVADLSSLT